MTNGARRPLAALWGGLLATATLVALSSPAQAAEPAPHWGHYQWAGGQETAAVRAFWLVDRTADPTLNYIIQGVADAWNSARDANPELPFVAVYRDNANPGKCFVNETPGYSIASACIVPGISTFGSKGLFASKGSPHFLGAAFAVSDGLPYEEAFNVVCHSFGHLMGLPDSNDTQSCMSHNFSAPAKWYRAADAEAVLALYAHDDGQAPTGAADTYATPEDVPLTVAAPGVLANDTDVDGDALTAVKVSDPAQGAVTLNANGSFTYTPNANFNGSDTFTYKARGGGADSAPITVTVTVTPVADVPVAVADSFTTDEDIPLTVDAPGVLGNDTDPEGGLSALKVSNPSHGTLVLNTNGSFTYTPAANFNGTDSFTYKANDGTADSNTVTVTIAVNAVNDAPVAVNDTYTTPRAVPLAVSGPGLLGNDTDVEASPLTAAKASDPEHGSLTLNADGSFLYTPQIGFTGTDSFTYRASDGAAQSAPATVTITVQPLTGE
ncbi:MAG: cadherin-like domain-containing protein [Actinomycetota bacterium]|nr:cadherin-like domain-containing protein [Actinomycetota bacterium]